MMQYATWSAGAVDAVAKALRRTLLGSARKSKNEVVNVVFYEAAITALDIIGPDLGDHTGTCIELPEAMRTFSRLRRTMH